MPYSTFLTYLSYMTRLLFNYITSLSPPHKWERQYYTFLSITIILHPINCIIIHIHKISFQFSHFTSTLPIYNNHITSLSTSPLQRRDWRVWQRWRCWTMVRPYGRRGGMWRAVWTPCSTLLPWLNNSMVTTCFVLVEFVFFLTFLDCIFNIK